MKKSIFIILVVLLLTLAAGCGKESVLVFQKDKVQSLTIYAYDTDNNITKSTWLYSKSDMDEFLTYLESLNGKKTDSLEIDTLGRPVYGIEFYTDVTITLLITENYAINYDGEYYQIDIDEIKKMCQSIKGESDSYDGVSVFVNHRYLSLLNSTWDTEYMPVSRWTMEPRQDILLTGTATISTVNSDSLEFSLVNNSTDTISYGSGLEFEAFIGSTWYNIDSMINDNISLAWTDELRILDPGKTSTETFNSLKYYQPLPAGRYRIIKELLSATDSGYAAYEFEIE